MMFQSVLSLALLLSLAFAAAANDGEGTALPSALRGRMLIDRISRRRHPATTPTFVDDGSVMNGRVCTKSSECIDGSFCMAGKCKPHNSCATDLDCLNTENSVVDCMGIAACDADVGQCHCTGDIPCNTGLLPGCNPNVCDIAQKCPGKAHHCVMDVCADCKPRFFSADGTHVCESS